MGIKLSILASDILSSKYLNTEDCAITRALKRAGFNYRDCGLEITDNDDDDAVIISDDNESYKELRRKILGMYATKDGEKYTSNGCVVTPLPIEDFDFIIYDNIT